jgi:hypothetical protein
MIETGDIWNWKANNIDENLKYLGTRVPGWECFTQECILTVSSNRTYSRD